MNKKDWITALPLKEHFNTFCGNPALFSLLHVSTLSFYLPFSIRERREFLLLLFHLLLDLINVIIYFAYGLRSSVSHTEKRDKKSLSIRQRREGGSLPREFGKRRNGKEERGTLLPSKIGKSCLFVLDFGHVLQLVWYQVSSDLWSICWFFLYICLTALKQN